MKKFISDTLKNNLKSILKDVSVPQKKSLTLLVKQLQKEGTGILRHLGNVDPEKILPKSLGQKFSHHLGRVDLLKPVEQYADRKIVKKLKKNSVIAYDLTDINKDSAKKIEKVDNCFDGSTRRRSKGFFVHGVGFGKWLWRMQLHDNGKNFLPQIRKRILNHLIKITKSKNPIWAFDRGNDDAQFFEYLIEKTVRFVIRLKKNRTVILHETGEVVSVESLEPGKYKVLIPTQKTKNKKYFEFHEYFLIIKKNKMFKTPIRLLCSSDLEAFSDAEIQNFYLQRWGVENAFKEIKTQLKLESIRVLRFKKFQNLVSLMHFCLLMNQSLFQRVQQNASGLLLDFSSKVYAAYLKFQKTFTRTANMNSFVDFLRSNVPAIFVHRKIHIDQAVSTLFDFIEQKPKTS
jgi:hypothetical protein